MESHRIVIAHTMHIMHQSYGGTNECAICVVVRIATKTILSLVCENIHAKLLFIGNSMMSSSSPSSAVCTHSFKRNIQALHPAYKWLYDICALCVFCDAKDNGKLCQKPNMKWNANRSHYMSHTTIITIIMIFPRKKKRKIETKNRTRAHTAQFPIYLFFFGFKLNSFCCFLSFFDVWRENKIELNPPTTCT